MTQSTTQVQPRELIPRLDPVVRRRRISALVVVGLLAAGTAGLLAGGDSDTPAPAENTTAADPEVTPAPPPDPVEPPAPDLSDQRISAAGASIAPPRGWRSDVVDGGVSIVSPQGDLRLVIVRVGPAAIGGAALDDAIATVKENYPRAELVREPGGGGKRVAGLPATSAVMAAGKSGGIGILLTAVSSDRGTYLASVFSAASAPGKRFVQAQASLNSARLR